MLMVLSVCTVSPSLSPPSSSLGSLRICWDPFGPLWTPQSPLGPLRSPQALLGPIRSPQALLNLLRSPQGPLRAPLVSFTLP